MARTIASRLSVLFVSALFMSFCLLALSSRGAAQGHETGTAKNQSVSVTGCLQKGTEPNGYHLTDDNSKMWELSSRSVKLAAHVGHKVTVTGVEVKKSKSAEEKAEEHEKTESAGKPYGDLTVKSLKMVSETCSGH
jgi:hypothetical protein